MSESSNQPKKASSGFLFWAILILVVLSGGLGALLSMNQKAQPLEFKRAEFYVSTAESGRIAGDYGTTKLFIDEIAQESREVIVHFETDYPQPLEVEVFTNLNRRNFADQDADGDGYDDGIQPVDGNMIRAGDEQHYFKAYPMKRLKGGSYELRLAATQTGAYRMTVRWRKHFWNPWTWYNEIDKKRDHAIVVSPSLATQLRLYAMNVLNVEASGDQKEERSTFEDLTNEPGAPHQSTNRWDLDYLERLGVNGIWLQPIHVTSREGREPEGGWGKKAPPYEPGSPYAIRNFFEVSPFLTARYDPQKSELENRKLAKEAFVQFVRKSDDKQMSILLDVPFNHTGHDAELGEVGVRLFQSDEKPLMPTAFFRDVWPQFYSKTGAYDERAPARSWMAIPPDRFDFGTWPDALDIYFGNYSNLVTKKTEKEKLNFTSEADEFDFTASTWNAVDFYQNQKPKNITRQTWKYFSEYLLYWLEVTRPAGKNRNSSTEPGLTLEQRALWDSAGIDGLRADFAQGLPPRAWEYISNVARKKKWNLVLMAESLDGGAVARRSNRHFDILNEDIFYWLREKPAVSGLVETFGARKRSYSNSLILLNLASHDEDREQDPWKSFAKYAALGAEWGVPLIAYGAELGVTQTWGFDHFEKSLSDRPRPHFKRYNSMMPAWKRFSLDRAHLFYSYSAINQARKKYPLLSSGNRIFLSSKNPQVPAFIKFDRVSRQAILVAANLTPDQAQKAVISLPPGPARKMRIEKDRQYNVKNVVAYENLALGVTGRRDQYLWAKNLSGEEILKNGISVTLRALPKREQDWKTAPFEPLYLKLEDLGPAKPADSK